MNFLSFSNYIAVTSFLATENLLIEGIKLSKWFEIFYKLQMWSFNEKVDYYEVQKYSLKLVECDRIKLQNNTLLLY